MRMVDVGTFKTLDTLDAADQARVDGKAYNCARLRQAGFPVPDALIVPSDATESPSPFNRYVRGPGACRVRRRARNCTAGDVDQSSTSIDWLFVKGAAHATGGVERVEQASDHYPLIATIGR